MSKIEEQAILVVADVDAFLGTPLPGHDGRTSRELAAESLNGYMAVQRELDRIRDADRATAEAERQHKEMVGKLWDRVNSRIPDRARAALWPLQKWPELGGMKPIEFCKDKKSLERCSRYWSSG